MVIQLNFINKDTFDFRFTSNFELKATNFIIVFISKYKCNWVQFEET